MNVIFDPHIGRLYDLLFAVLSYKKLNDLPDQFKTCDYNKALEEAYLYLWDGLDAETPGLEAITAVSQYRDCYLFRYCIPNIWKWKSADVFIEDFNSHIQNELRYALLSFFDKKEHPSKYYSVIAANTARLHDFVNGLDVSLRVKLELLGFASGSRLYDSSLKALFTELAERLDRVYEKNAETIRFYYTKMQNQIASADEFILMQTPEFIEGYQKHPYGTARVAMSFINPSVVYYRKNEGDVDVYLGAENLYQRTYINGSLSKHGLFFKALSDESRMRVVELLRERRMYIGEISSELHIPLTTLTYHIKMLHDAGMIKLLSEGKKTFCIFDPAAFGNAICALGSAALVREKNNTGRYV